MALNIIVETSIQPYEKLKESTNIYSAGAVIFDKEGFGHIVEEVGPVSGIKIADGEHIWSELSYLNITETIASKWRNIAEGSGITTGKLVTLPDMNFAYVVVDAEQNKDLIQEITNTLATTNLYYKVHKNEEYLELTANNASSEEEPPGLDFSIPRKQDEIQTINGITFVAKENSNLVKGSITYNFKDAAAWQKITDTRQELLNEINEVSQNLGTVPKLNIQPTESMHNSEINLYIRNRDDHSELYAYPSTTMIFTDGYKELDDGGYEHQGEKLYFNLYHYSQGNLPASDRKYTQYYFPEVENVSENKAYQILTTSPTTVVSIANGGTGANNAEKAAEELNVVSKSSDIEDSVKNSFTGQMIHSNFAIKNSSNGNFTIIGSEKGNTTSGKRGLAIGSGDNEWIVYAKTVDNSLRYCLGNDNVRVDSSNPTVLRGAAWNDYAEAREAETLEAGRVVVEKGDGSMIVSTERLMPSAKITSDTFGFIIGETKTCKTPIAVCGRVLAYPNEDRKSYSLGDAVCSGPNGTISKMTREEIINYPERIIGTVSEIPNYEVWGEEKVKVNGRIWIYVK